MRALAVFRPARFLVCIFLCVCMVFACVAPVYAAAVLPVVALGSLAVIASVLVATGLVATGSADFDGLCSDIYDGLSAASKIGPKITLSVLAGVSYLHTSIVEMITAEAVKKGAYTPISKRMIEVDGYSYPYYADSDAAIADFVPVVTFSSQPDVFTRTDAGSPYIWCVSSAPWGEYSSADIVKPNVSGVSFVFFRTRYYADKLPLSLGPVIYIENEHTLYTTYSYYTNSQHYVSTLMLGGNHTVTGSISVRFPWEVTDDLPSISSSGVLDKVNAGWLARERAIDGTASLPLSVPADTVAGAAAQTQTDAQAGTKTEGAGGGEESMDKNKSKITLLPLLKCFPFSLPWDVVAGFQMLSAAEVKPIFEIPFKMNYGDVVVDEPIQLDLTKFDAVFQIARALELLAFGIGLAIFTKKIIWG